MQVPFDYAQGRLSTVQGAINAPNSAQDDSNDLEDSVAKPQGL